MVAVGLARESSAVAAKELAYEYQVERLQEYGCQWVYGDRISGTRDDRKGLTAGFPHYLVRVSTNVYVRSNG